MSSKINHLALQSTIVSKGRLLNLEKPIVMGILNATPDSFYNVSNNNIDTILELAAQMIEDGATILDIGGTSTKPGARAISPGEEINRIKSVISTIKELHPDTWISVDTYYAEVAAAAIGFGADIVNDISAGLLDPDMLPTVANLGVPYIGMHMQGKPDTMQIAPHYSNVTQEVFTYLKEMIWRCKDAGIKDIIVDPGFGFGKTLEHNYQLMQEMEVLSLLGQPVLAGISRKSMIYNLLGKTAAEALNGTTALHMAALMKGAHILRAHDVKAARETILIFNALTGNQQPL